MKIRQSSNRGLILVAIVTAGMVTLSLMQWNIGNKTHIIEKNQISAIQLTDIIQQKLKERFQNFVIYSQSPNSNQEYFNQYLANKKIDETTILQSVNSTSFIYKENLSTIFKSKLWLNFIQQINDSKALLTIELERIDLHHSKGKNELLEQFDIQKYHKSLKSTISIVENFVSDFKNHSHEELQKLSKRQDQLFKNYGILLLVIISAMFLEFYSRRKNLISPIEELTHVVERMSTGDYDIRAKVTSENEVGLLANNFNNMADAIKNDIEQKEKVNRKMVKLKDDAEAANVSKSNFLANMSHEIRTPMNAILGMSHLALETQLDNKQRNYIQQVHYSAGALLGIINDILDFSKIEAGKIEIERINFQLDEVLDNITSLVGFKAQEKALELMVDIPVDIPIELIGDPLRLGQILINLGNNAVKFTEKGEIIFRIELIELDAQQSDQQSDQQVQLHFSVTDTGVGMTAEQQSKLFQSFSQADASTTRKYGGTGLGLVISKKLTELMNGKIWVESEQNIGSTFHFTARFDKQPVDTSAKRSLIKDITGLRVLIVDDNISSRKIISSMLEAYDLHIEQVSSGESALTQLIQQNEDESYQLVIVDWVMPGMDGIELAKAITNSDLIKNKPKIIMLTSHGKEEAIQAAHGVDIQSFCTKPIMPSHMINAILVAMGHKKKHYKNTLNHNEDMQQTISQLNGAHVLLVEDNKINQQVAREFLERALIDVDIANNGQESLEKLEKETYDCVLMDIQMPVLDGYEATKKIREQDKFKDLPVLAMTANAMTQDKKNALDSGMNDHIAKPIDPKDMFDKLLQWINLNNIDRSKATISKTTISKTKITNDSIELSLPLQLPGIDIESAIQRKGFSETFFYKLLKDFYHDHHQDLHKINDDLDNKIEEEAKRMVHTIKGIAGTIGADKLYESSFNLDLAFKNSEPYQELLNVFSQDFERVISSIKDLLSTQQVNESNHNTVTAVDEEELLRNLSELISMLEMMDAESEDKVKEFAHQYGHLYEQEILSTLINDVENFEFEQALETIKLLKK
ncbi:MAG: response regulator [Gammaproteobacteria bacterium]|nr:response regulator [Gammaproteobacteria bacterium]